MFSRRSPRTVDMLVPGSYSLSIRVELVLLMKGYGCGIVQGKDRIATGLRLKRSPNKRTQVVEAGEGARLRAHILSYLHLRN